MNRKDFDILARAFKRSKPPSCDPDFAGWYNAAEAVAYGIKEDCAHFDYNKFLKRCGAGT